MVSIKPGVQTKINEILSSNDKYQFVWLYSPYVEITRSEEKITNFLVLEDGSLYSRAAQFEHCYVRGGQVKDWQQLAPAQTNSDRSIKNTITSFNNLSYLEEEKQDKFFDALIPSSYKYNNGSSNRLHMGFIAQDVHDALTNADLNSDDYAYICCDINPITEEKTNWRLRYEEFIALNTWQIQKLKTQVAELEEKLKALENR